MNIPEVPMTLTSELNGCFSTVKRIEILLTPKNEEMKELGSLGSASIVRPESKLVDLRNLASEINSRLMSIENKLMVIE